MSDDIRELFQGKFFLPDALNLRKRVHFPNYLHKKGIGGFIEVHEPLNFSRGFLELGIN
jgi:hypothetical protein